MWWTHQLGKRRRSQVDYLSCKPALVVFVGYLVGWWWPFAFRGALTMRNQWKLDDGGGMRIVAFKHDAIVCCVELEDGNDERQRQNYKHTLLGQLWPGGLLPGQVVVWAISGSAIETHKRKRHNPASFASQLYCKPTRYQFVCRPRKREKEKEASAANNAFSIYTFFHLPTFSPIKLEPKSFG